MKTKKKNCFRDMISTSFSYNDNMNTVENEKFENEKSENTHCFRYHLLYISNFIYHTIIIIYI